MLAFDCHHLVVHIFYSRREVSPSWREKRQSEYLHEEVEEEGTDEEGKALTKVLAIFLFSGQEPFPVILLIFSKIEPARAPQHYFETAAAMALRRFCSTSSVQSSNALCKIVGTIGPSSEDFPTLQTVVTEGACCVCQHTHTEYIPTAALLKRCPPSLYPLPHLTTTQACGSCG